MSQKNIKNLKELSSKNFNILLLGGTNFGKSTLINEYLQLENDKKAKEGEGGETLTITLHHILELGINKHIHCMILME